MSFQEYASGLEEKAKFGKLKPQYLVGLATIVLIVILVLGYQLFFANAADKDSFSVETSQRSIEGSQQANTTVFVHVSGCVNSPGLVELEEGSRIATAVEKAGGTTADANLDSINLAKKVEDGEQIIVPSRTAHQTQDAGTASTTSEAGGSTSNSGKININTADSAELQKISGIGESKAAKIIAYREANGKFKSVEDLTNVSGIGDKTLSSIRDQICV